MIQTVATDKGTIEFSDFGKGIPVLFIHGGHSNAKEKLFCKGFGLQRHRLIVPSRPGYGNTPLNGMTTPQQTADLFIALMDYLKIEKAVIYAISAGGLTGIELAARYPDRVKKLVLASAVTKRWLDKKGKIYKTGRRLFNPTTEKYTWKMVHFFTKVMPYQMAKSFQKQLSTFRGIKPTEKEVAEFSETFKNYRSKNGFVHDIDHEVKENLISKIHCPTFIIHSINDKSVLPEHAEYASSKIKNAQLELIRNRWGHLFWIGDEALPAIRKSIEFIDG